MQRSLTFHSFPRNSERQVQAWRQAERGGFFNKIETDRDRGRWLLWWLLLFKGALRQVLSPHCVLSLESQYCSNPCVCVCVSWCHGRRYLHCSSWDMTLLPPPTPCCSVRPEVLTYRLFSYVWPQNSLTGKIKDVSCIEPNVKLISGWLTSDTKLKLKIQPISFHVYSIYL